MLAGLGKPGEGAKQGKKGVFTAPKTEYPAQHYPPTHWLGVSGGAEWLVLGCASCFALATRLPPCAREPMKAPCTAVGSRGPLASAWLGSARIL